MTAIVNKTPETKEPSSFQQFLLYYDIIPKKIVNCTPEDLIKIGFVFKEPLRTDLFITGIIPKGWKKQIKEDDPNRIKLIDVYNNRRAEIFYNGTVTDNDPYIVFLTRFMFHQLFNENDKCCICVCDISNRSNAVIIKEICQLNDFTDEIKIKKYMDLAKGWLNENYPDWLDPTAYWD